MNKEVELALLVKRIADLEESDAKKDEELKELKDWKRACTIWAAWWAGVCAAVMAAATLLRTYWSEIGGFFRGGH